MEIGREKGPVEETGEQARRLLVGQGCERDRRGVQFSAAPIRPPDQELGSRGAEDEQGNVSRPVDQVVEEVEEPIVGPVEVLEDQHRRPPLRERFEKAAPRRGTLVRAFVTRPSLLREPDERPEMPGDPAAFVSVGEQLRHGSIELVGRLALGSVSRIPASAFTISPSAQ